MPYYIKDPKRDPNFDNHPNNDHIGEFKGALLDEGEWLFWMPYARCRAEVRLCQTSVGPKARTFGLFGIRA